MNFIFSLQEFCHQNSSKKVHPRVFSSPCLQHFCNSLPAFLSSFNVHTRADSTALFHLRTSTVSIAELVWSILPVVSATWVQKESLSGEAECPRSSGRGRVGTARLHCGCRGVWITPSLFFSCLGIDFLEMGFSQSPGGIPSWEGTLAVSTWGHHNWFQSETFSQSAFIFRPRSLTAHFTDFAPPRKVKFCLNQRVHLRQSKFCPRCKSKQEKEMEQGDCVAGVLGRNFPPVLF